MNAEEISEEYPLDKYKYLAKGAYGTVYDLNDGYVLKISKIDKYDLKNSTFCNELKIYNKLSKSQDIKIIPDIRKFKYSTLEQDNKIKTYIETEKLDKLSHDYIEDLLDKLKDPKITNYLNLIEKIKVKSKIKKFYLKVLDNYDILHKNDIVHLDGRLDNIMLSKNGDIYFIDFGLSEILNKNIFDMNSIIVQQARISLSEYASGKNLSMDVSEKILKCFLRIYDIWYFYTDFIRVIDRVIEDHKEYRNIIKKRIDRILKDTGCEDCKDSIMEIIEITLKLKLHEFDNKRYYVSLFKYHIDLDNK
jgi:serine/threonine protein kinase